MRRVTLCLSLATVLLAPALPALAQPAFVNGLVIPGNTLDATGNTEANSGRFGFVQPDWARPGAEKPEPWHWEFGLIS